jgi:aryl-alcohol dehydrogenase-like predicted oxidoreductase
MKYRQIGNTELTVSEIGVPLRPLATNDYGHVTEQDTVNLLTRAFDMGFTYFDAADSYTEGYGERVLARALGRRRHDVVISTKAGYDFYRPVIDPDERGKSQRWTPGFIQYACEQSLRRLDTDYIDLFLLHHPDPDVIDDDELFGLLDDLVVAGKTRYYGVVLDDTPESEETGEGAIDHRKVSAVEMTYGLVEQEPGRNLIRRAQDTTTAIISYNPSASGALENIRGRDDEATNLNERLRQEAFERYRREREAVVDALREFGGDVGTWAIKFALASPTVASTLPIATSYARLLELAEIADRDDLPREFIERAFEVYDSEIGNRQVWRD